MSVDIFSYTIPKGTASDVAATNCISFLHAKIDSSVVTNKTMGMANWVTTNNNSYDSGTLLGAVSFSFGGTDFCIAAFQGTGTTCYLNEYAKNVRGTIYKTLYSFNKNDTSDVVVNFLIGQNQDYFLFRITSYYSLNENSTMLVIRIDAPTNAADTDVFISLLPGLNAYNKAFDVEDIANTVPYLKTDAGGVGSLYDSNFTRNYYNNKIPLYNLYAFTTSQGIRGKISNLIVMPNSYSTTIGSFYSVNGVVYVGLGSLNGKIDSLWNGVLLRCY